MLLFVLVHEYKMLCKSALEFRPKTFTQNVKLLLHYSAQ